MIESAWVSITLWFIMMSMKRTKHDKVGQPVARSLVLKGCWLHIDIEDFQLERLHSTAWVNAEPIRWITFTLGQSCPWCSQFWFRRSSESRWCADWTILNSNEFEITLLNFSEALARLISFQNSPKFNKIHTICDDIHACMNPVYSNIHMGAVRKSRSQIYELMRLLCFARLLKPASR